MFIRSTILVAVSACAIASCKSTGKAGPAVGTPLASKTAITCDVDTAYAAIDSLLTRTIALRRGYEALSRSNPAHPLLIISAPSVDSAIVRLAEILRPFRAGLVERCGAAARCSGAASDCRALGDGLVAFEEEMTRDRYIWLADKSFEAYGENLAKMEAILAKGPDGVGFIDLQESDEAAANLSDSIERLYTEGDVARPDRCYAPAAANASAAAPLLIPASAQGDSNSPAAGFSWPAPPTDADVEIERALFVEKFGFSQAQFDENVGFVLFDMKNDRIMRSHNSDRLFPLASVTKLFTMLAVAETFETIQEWARRDLAFMIRTSSNQRASTWLQLAYAQARLLPVDYQSVSEATTTCWVETGEGDGVTRPRSAAQRKAELDAARYFLDEFKPRYGNIDWENPPGQIVDGAGCERRPTWRDPDSDGYLEDALTPVQVLSILHVLRFADFGGWSASEILPQRSPATGREILRDNNCRTASSTCKPFPAGGVSYKTGTDAGGVKTIAGYIPSGDDPYAYGFVLLINLGDSNPDKTGVRGGKRLVSDFVKAWSDMSAAHAATEN